MNHLNTKSSAKHPKPQSNVQRLGRQVVYYKWGGGGGVWGGGGAQASAADCLTMNNRVRDKENTTQGAFTKSAVAFSL